MYNKVYNKTSRGCLLTLMKISFIVLFFFIDCHKTLKNCVHYQIGEMVDSALN